MHVGGGRSDEKKIGTIGEIDVSGRQDSCSSKTPEVTGFFDRV